jgi:hypothetical protein
MESIINWLLVAVFSLTCLSVFANALYVKTGWSGIIILKERDRRINWYKKVCIKHRPFSILFSLMTIAVIIVLFSIAMGYLGSPDRCWVWIIWGCIQAGWFLILNWLYLIAACEEIAITG